MSNPEPHHDADYRLLGLAPGASAADVKKAYRELVKRWHPDRFALQSPWERQRAEATIREITAAYRRISRSWSSQARPVGGASGTPSARESARSPEWPNAGPRKPSQPGGQPSRQDTLKAKVRRALYSLPFQRPPWDTRSFAVAAGLLLLAIGMSYLPISLIITPVEEPLSPQETGALQADAPEDNPTPVPPPPAAPSTEALRAVPPPWTPPRSEASPPPRYFTLGSSPEDVLRVQGPPQRIRGQTWIFGLSEVQFKDGRVARYDNFDGSLQVRMLPAPSPSSSIPEFFTLGATTDEVLLVQGTPTRVDSNRWAYGFSEIRFRNGRVEDYNNTFGALKVRLLPSDPDGTARIAARRGYFTIGSPRDEVIAVQGTPTSITGNFWYYQMSNISFRDGKVQYVVNSDGNLRFVPPDEPLP